MAASLGLAAKAKGRPYVDFWTDGTDAASPRLLCIVITISYWRIARWPLQSHRAFRIGMGYRLARRTVLERHGALPSPVARYGAPPGKPPPRRRGAPIGLQICKPRAPPLGNTNSLQLQFCGTGELFGQLPIELGRQRKGGGPCISTRTETNTAPTTSIWSATIGQST